MSKIEKALRRARGDKSLVVMKGGQTVSGSNGQAGFPTTSDNRTDNITAYVQSAAAIVHMQEKGIRERSDLSMRGIIYPEMTGNAVVQAFREIRTRILQKSHGKNCVIVVSSVTGRGGSTFVATNLAAAFAFDSGKTALLVDCNLRNPALHRLIADGSARGLIDYLESEDMDIGDIIHQVGIERLRIIPAGEKREIPGEYFTSEKLKRLLGAIRQRYHERFIVLDAPPISEMADAQILAELCDYVVLVVPYGTVTNNQIDECIKTFGSSKLLGFVFNNEPQLPDLPWVQVLAGTLRPLQDWGSRFITAFKNVATKRRK